jgi:hypothetical protein
MFKQDRVLSEEEKFHMLGFGARLRLGDLTASMLRDLTGEAMAVPSVTTVLYSMLLTLPFPGLWRKPSHTKVGKARAL